MIKLKHLALLSSFVLAACATGGHHHLNQSLQHYVGQTAAQVRSQLDLNKMGFKTTREPIQTVESLSYTIIREMNMGTPNISHSISMGTPMPTPSNGGYNIEMKCQVWFNLKDEIGFHHDYTSVPCIKSQQYFCL